LRNRVSFSNYLTDFPDLDIQAAHLRSDRIHLHNRTFTSSEPPVVDPNHRPILASHGGARHSRPAIPARSTPVHFQRHFLLRVVVAEVPSYRLK
jgi:hypothetical protein